MMAVVFWSSELMIIVPDVGKPVAVLNVNVPIRLARQEPEANVIALAGLAPPDTLKSRVAPLWTAMEEALIEFKVKTKSRPLFTVIGPMVLLPDARFRMRSLPPIVSPVPPLIAPVKYSGMPILSTPPPVLSVIARAVVTALLPVVCNVPPAMVIPPLVLPRLLSELIDTVPPLLMTVP